MISAAFALSHVINATHSVFGTKDDANVNSKINWPRSLVIGDNDIKKDVAKLFRNLHKVHKSASVFLKDYENDLIFVIWWSFFVKLCYEMASNSIKSMKYVSKKALASDSSQVKKIWQW